MSWSLLSRVQAKLRIEPLEQKLPKLPEGGCHMPRHDCMPVIQSKPAPKSRINIPDYRTKLYTPWNKLNFSIPRLVSHCTHTHTPVSLVARNRSRKNSAFPGALSNLLCQCDQLVQLCLFSCFCCFTFPCIKQQLASFPVAF